MAYWCVWARWLTVGTERPRDHFHPSLFFFFTLKFLFLKKYLGLPQFADTSHRASWTNIYLRLFYYYRAAA